MQGDVPVKATRTTFRIVETLANHEGLTLADLSDRLDLATSTVHDHLTTLERLGYVVRDGKKYHVSLRFLDVGGAARQRMPIYQVAKPEVESLADETGEHASLTIEEQGLGVLMYVSRGENAVKVGARAGMRMPLGTTAPGKAILAHLPEDQVQDIIDRHGLPAVTEDTITDEEELHEELSKVRERGFATDMGERVEGVRAVAVPIHSHGTVRGAISIGGPKRRMTGDRFESEIPEMLLQSANVIEVNLSHTR